MEEQRIKQEGEKLVEELTEMLDATAPLIPPHLAKIDRMLAEITNKCIKDLKRLARPLDTPPKTAEASKTQSEEA